MSSVGIEYTQADIELRNRSVPANDSNSTLYDNATIMEGAFTHLGNHLISDSAPTINAGDDLSAIDPDESILDREYGRGNLSGGPRRRQHDDEDEGTEVFDDDDTESMISMPVDGVNGKPGLRAEEDKEKVLPQHACA